MNPIYRKSCWAASCRKGNLSAFQLRDIGVSALSLASACLTRNPARSAALFAEVAAKYDVRQAWLGFAAARLRLTDRTAAAGAQSAAAAAEQG